RNGAGCLWRRGRWPAPFRDRRVACVAGGLRLRPAAAAPDDRPGSLGSVNNRTTCGKAVRWPRSHTLRHMRPVEFEERFAATWALWVLDHGFPDLPDQMVEGLSVPIAFWAGQRVGAVMFVQRCPHDEECEADEHFTTDEVSFRRT